MLDIHVNDKTYDGRRVIENLHLNITDGEQVSLVGPSGAGKSTLLNLVSGLDTAYDGRISVQMGDTRGLSIGMMFQEPRLMPWLSVLDNVKLVGSGSFAEDRARQMLAMVDMADYCEYFPEQLSGGMRKRVAIARAFMPRPKLMLVDEPFSSLDDPSADSLRRLVKNLCREYQATLLYVTHDLREAIQMADRVLFFSTSPMRLLLDFRTPVEEADVDEHIAIETCRSRLLQQYPRLLQGCLQT